MAAVTLWVKNIILVVLFASFMELLLPSTSMKKFIRVIMGIFIMLAILNPVLQFFQNARPDEHIAALGIKESSQKDTIDKVVESTMAKREELLSLAYKQDLAKQISTVVKSIAGVQDAQATVNIGKDNKISKIFIYLKPGAAAKSNIKIDTITMQKTEQPKVQQNLLDKVKQTVSELYQVPQSNIEIQPLS